MKNNVYLKYHIGPNNLISNISLNIRTWMIYMAEKMGTFVTKNLVSN